ncbi:MAG: DUF2784 domain-containing protein [Pseudobdellovibrionaceae bacterium]|nr:DUF2784 domain-containing protein [Pseudobdellovibrionaceae bacterium]
MLPQWLLVLCDHGLMMFHLVIIGINVLGWIWLRTRPLQRWVLLLTTLSWVGLGAFYGLGYCFLTDWHWTVKRQLGERALPPSYIQYILHNKLGFNFPDYWVDVGTGTVFVLLLLITALQMFRSRRSAA